MLGPVMSIELTDQINIGDELLDLTCPACDAALLEDPGYLTNRVCSRCQRHFWISARERIAALASGRGFAEFDYSSPLLDTIDQHQHRAAADRRFDARERSALEDALVTGVLTVNGARIVVAALDPVLLAGGLGIVSTDKLVNAIRAATEDHLPVAVFCAGGSHVGASGLAVAAQGLRLAAAVETLHRAGQPLIAIASHGTGGNVLTAIVALADLRIAEPDCDLSGSLAPDLILTREHQLSAITDLESVLAGRVAGEFALADHPAGKIAIRQINALPVMQIDLDTARITNPADQRVLFRALDIATSLELGIVLRVTGETGLPPTVDQELRGRLQRHTPAVVVVMNGMCLASHFEFLPADLIVGEADLHVKASRPKPFSAAEAVQFGSIDRAVGLDLDAALAPELQRLARLSPDRLRQRRLTAMDRRAATADPFREAAKTELFDLHQIQAVVRRSMDEWRSRFERREMRVPAIHGLQGLKALRPPGLPRLSLPELAEVRNRWLHRMRAAAPLETRETLDPNPDREGSED